MTETTPATAPADATPRGLFARIAGVFFSPRATFAEVAARPRWFGVLAFTSIVVAGGFFVLLSTDVGKTAVLDQQAQFLESFGVKLNDEAYERMAASVDQARFRTPVLQVIAIPVVLVAVSGLLLGIFNALLGGDARFKQVFAIMAHSSVITALQNVFSLPLDYARETLSSPTTLHVLMPFVDEGTFLGKLLGMIDLFQIWATITLAIGLGVLYKRRTTPIAIGLFIVYFVIVAAIAAVRSALSPS